MIVCMDGVERVWDAGDDARRCLAHRLECSLWIE
jgi:hypothetical protein